MRQDFRTEAGKRMDHASNALEDSLYYITGVPSVLNLKAKILHGVSGQNFLWQETQWTARERSFNVWDFWWNMVWNSSWSYSVNFTCNGLMQVKLQGVRFTSEEIKNPGNFRLPTRTQHVWFPRFSGTQQMHPADLEVFMYNTVSVCMVSLQQCFLNGNFEHAWCSFWPCFTSQVLTLHMFLDWNHQ